MNPHKDVLLILQSHDSKNCQVRSFAAVLPDALSEGVKEGEVRTEGGKETVRGRERDTHTKRESLGSAVLTAVKLWMVQEFYKYVKRSADRFIELGHRDTVEVAKFDVERSASASVSVSVSVSASVSVSVTGSPALSVFQCGWPMVLFK